MVRFPYHVSLISLYTVQSTSESHSGFPVPWQAQRRAVARGLSEYRDQEIGLIRMYTCIYILYLEHKL